MRILPIIAVVFALILPASRAAAAEKAMGVLIYADSGVASEQSALATEYVSAEKFSAVVNLVTVDGVKMTVQNGLVYARVDYAAFRSDAFSEILKEADLVPISTAQKNLTGFIARFPRSRKLLEPLMAELKTEQDRFRQGQGKWNGRWYATRQAANDAREQPLRLAAAEQQKEIEAAKAQEEQMEQAAKREAAGKEAAIADEKAGAQAFQARAAGLFGKFLNDPSWKQRGEDLSKIIPVAAELKTQVEESGLQGKNLRSRLKSPEAQKICDKAFPLLDAATAWAAAADAFAAGDASKGTGLLQDFLAQNSSVTTPELSPMWDSLLTFFKACRQREEAAASHVQKAKELSALGKNNQAIKEYETAHSLFPDRDIAPMIEKLRKESLGL